MPAASACKRVLHSALATQFGNTVYFCLLSIQRHNRARLHARSCKGQGCLSHFPRLNSIPAPVSPVSRGPLCTASLVANTTKRAQFLHSVQNAEASPLSLLASCLPVLTPLFFFPPPLSHWQAASLTYCSLFMLLLSLPSLLFESA